MHIKYIYFYIRTNNFIYFNHLIRQLSSWAAFHKESSGEKIEKKLFERVSEVYNSFS